MPDIKTYMLDYTGDEVNEAIKKALENASGMKILESSAGSPYNIDSLVTPGIYSVMYLQTGDGTGEYDQTLANMHPVYIQISEDTSEAGVTKYAQTVIGADGSIYHRVSEDNGATWPAWSAVNTEDVHVAITPEEINQIFANANSAAAGAGTTN